MFLGLLVVTGTDFFGLDFYITTGFGQSRFLCKTYGGRATTDYHAHLASASHVRNKQMLQRLQQTRAPQLAQSESFDPVDQGLLDQMAAFHTREADDSSTGDDTDSNDSTSLSITREAEVTLFNPQSPEEADSEPEMDWYNMLFETVVDDSPSDLTSQQANDRVTNSLWFPFQSQEVSVLLGACHPHLIMLGTVDN